MKFKKIYDKSGVMAEVSEDYHEVIHITTDQEWEIVISINELRDIVQIYNKEILDPIINNKELPAHHFFD